MKAVILAGGLGNRLKPFTEVIPKPLLPIGEKSILEIQIERLKEHGFDEIYLCCNYKSKYIENYFREHLKLRSTPLFIELRESDNPYKDKPNVLTGRQKKKRKRMIKKTKK